MKIKYIFLFLAAVLALSACDDQLDITPKGKTILDKTSDLEKLLNQKWDLGDPGPLCLVVNECYTDNDVPTVLSQKNTLNYALLTYDENADRANVTATDEIYSTAYQNIFYANTILSKADASEGEDTTKTLIKAEAHILRAYMHYLLVNIYAPQYDAATASQQSGVPYREDMDTHAQPKKISVAEDYDKILADLADDYILALPDKA
jgi:starch-binding outer membrane protein, SusD/RagB family